MIKYTPIIKTTDAEIKGYEELYPEVKENILPIFELTRSRPVKNYPTGDIHKRMSQIRDICNGNSFILDLTSHEDLSNEQIEALKDDTNGFQEWRFFLKKYNDLKIIPMIHLYPDDLSTCLQFLDFVSDGYECFAFRVGFDIDLEDLRLYLVEMANKFNVSDRLIVILDFDYFTEMDMDDLTSQGKELIGVLREFLISKISIVSSSFPSSVLERAQNGDTEGFFSILERDLHKRLQRSMGIPLLYGDYGSVHPIRYQMSGGNWVPRIDHVLDSQYIYKRYRRDKGSYILAAEEMLAWDYFDKDLKCWGVDQIKLAASGNPQGKSPSFWIAVRLNQHLTRMASIYR